MHSKTWVRIGAFLIILVAVSLSIFSTFPSGQEQVRETLMRVNWMLLSEPSGPGCEYCGPYESPVIVYDGENDTWQLQDSAGWNRAIFHGDDYSDDQSHPEDIWYTPNITVDGDQLGLDFLVRNRAGEDCVRADFNVTTEIENLNTTSGSPKGDTSFGAPSSVPVSNFATGGWCEVRVTTDLPRPGPEEILYLQISLTAPYTFTTPNNTSITFDVQRASVIESGSVPSDRIGPSPTHTHTPHYNRARLPRALAEFIITGKDAPKLVPAPTMRAS